MISPAKIRTVIQSYAVSIGYAFSSKGNIGRQGRLGLLSLALMLSACNRDDPPAGQVVATVDGEEITTAEVNEEARARNLPIGKDAAARSLVIRELIDRKLLAQEAVRRKLDRSPAHLLSVRRLEQTALAQLLVADGEQQVPSDEEAQRFIAANPMLFGDRKLLSVDRITIPAGASPTVRDALSKASSVDQMQAILTRAGLGSSRATETWDSAALPDPFRSVGSLAPADTFVIAGPGGVVAGKLISIVPQPVPPQQRFEVARSMLMQQARQQRMQALLEKLRSTSEVRLQSDPDPSIEE